MLIPQAAQILVKEVVGCSRKTRPSHGATVVQQTHSRAAEAVALQTHTWAEDGAVRPTRPKVDRGQE